MLEKCLDAVFETALTCTRESYNINLRDFDYYDKDGFELTLAERKILISNNVRLQECLNHWTWHNDWLKLSKTDGGLYLDHCILLHRADFAEDARAEIACYDHPGAAFMLSAKPKWGLDFAMDHLDGDAVEVLHIELDDYDYNRINDRKNALESWLLAQDWSDLAAEIRAKRDEWAGLKGPAQNDWKANYLLGWNKAEYTEKSCVFFQNQHK